MLCQVRQCIRFVHASHVPQPTMSRCYDLAHQLEADLLPFVYQVRVDNFRTITEKLIDLTSLTFFRRSAAFESLLKRTFRRIVLSLLTSFLGALMMNTTWNSFRCRGYSLPLPLFSPLSSPPATGGPKRVSTASSRERKTHS